MSFDEWSHENNPIQMLHEILKCLLTSGLMKITQIKLLHEILQCLLKSGLMKITQYKCYMKFSNVF